MSTESDTQANHMAIGSFDSAGCPTVEIEVSNPLGWKKKLTALVDTGFSGFLSIPILEAFPIGLLLHCTTSVVLADGQTQSKLTCLGMAHIAGEARIGSIIIEPQGDQVLLGMEFLREFKKKLVLDPTTGLVELVSTLPASP